jgi:hypothetical protein
MCTRNRVAPPSVYELFNMDVRKVATGIVEVEPRFRTPSFDVGTVPHDLFENALSSPPRKFRAAEAASPTAPTRATNYVRLDNISSNSVASCEMSFMIG